MVYVKMVNGALNLAKKALKEAGFTDHFILASFYRALFSSRQN